MSPDFGFQIALLVRLLLAAVLGAAIGIEREAAEQPAGMRTHLLVSVGSAAFTILSIYGFQAAGADPARVAAQIVSGIGFLGAGAILKYGVNVRGLTTAASLWTVAAVGMAVGAGMWGVALAATAIVIFSLGPLHFVERRLFGAPENRLRVEVTASDTDALGRLLAELDRYGDRVRKIGSTRTDAGAHRVDLEIREKTGRETSGVLSELDAIDGVTVTSTGSNLD